MNKYGHGWFNESHRHSLARQGIKTGRKINYALNPNISQHPQFIGNAPLPDKDKDGVPDIYDWDDDNDGIPDWKDSEGMLDIDRFKGKGVFNPMYDSTVDSDLDGVPDVKDLHPNNPFKAIDWAKLRKGEKVIWLDGMTGEWLEGTYGGKIEKGTQKGLGLYKIYVKGEVVITPKSRFKKRPKDYKPVVFAKKPKIKITHVSPKGKGFVLNVPARKGSYSFDFEKKRHYIVTDEKGKKVMSSGDFKSSLLMADTLDKI